MQIAHIIALSHKDLHTHTHILMYTVMLYSTREMYSKKCVIRQFYHCVNIIECTYKPRWYHLLHTQVTFYSLLLLSYKFIQHVPTLNTIACYNTLVSIWVSKHRKGSIKIQYYDLMGILLYMQSVIDQNAIIWCMTVYKHTLFAYRYVYIYKTRFSENMLASYFMFVYQLIATYHYFSE